MRLAPFQIQRSQLLRQLAEDFGDGTLAVDIPSGHAATDNLAEGILAGVVASVTAGPETEAGIVECSRFLMMDSPDADRMEDALRALENDTRVHKCLDALFADPLVDKAPEERVRDTFERLAADLISKYASGGGTTFPATEAIAEFAGRGHIRGYMVLGPKAPAEPDDPCFFFFPLADVLFKALWYKTGLFPDVPDRMVVDRKERDAWKCDENSDAEDRLVSSFAGGSRPPVSDILARFFRTNL